ncbi:MAG TPA: sugar transferase [Candidatus Saccharimonadia bacterium]|nr:sugar transferase [Candidatus Saccharimonadia bacterium]
MKSNATLIYNLFLVVGDFVTLVLAFVIAYVLRVSIDHHRVAHQISALNYFQAFVVLLPLWIIVFALIGLYENNISEKRFSEIGKLFVGSLLGILLVIGYSYGFNKVIFPAHLVAVYSFILSFGLLLIFRSLARNIKYFMFKKGFAITNLLIVGDTEMTHTLVESLFDYKTSGYKIIGIVGPKSHQKDDYKSIPIFDTFEQAYDKLGVERIHSIVQTELYSSTTKNNDVLTYAQTNHCAYRFIPGNSELFIGNIAVELFRSSIPVIAVHQTPLIGWGRIAKRLFDILFSLIVLIILSPILILISLLIILFNPGTILFSQERITRFNTTFKVYKFRTMKRKLSGRDPVTVFKEMQRPDLVEAFLAAKKLDNDPRITRLGGFIRKYSLDELPQLINIIKGDISLVGPRAIVPGELKYYKDKDSLLLSIKTGVTGLAQVSGRSDLDYYERAQLDLYYVQNWSFWLDLTILLKTIRVVFDRIGVK